MTTTKLSLKSLSMERFSSGRLPSRMALSKDCWEFDGFMGLWRKEGEDSSERWPCSLQTHTQMYLKSFWSICKNGVSLILVLIFYPSSFFFPTYWFFTVNQSERKANLPCLCTKQFAHAWTPAEHAKGIFSYWKSPFGQVQRGTDGVFGDILGGVDGAWQFVV